MPRPTYLTRRGAVYWFRMVVTKDIRGSYENGKKEETFTLGTRDYNDACHLVKIAAVKVDKQFEDHRRKLKLAGQAPVDEITNHQIKQFGKLYYTYLLEEDEERRLEGFEDFQDDPPPTPMPTFDGYLEDWEGFTEGTSWEHTRGITDEFVKGEAELFLWDFLGVKLKGDSPSWPMLYRELQEAIIKAGKGIKQRNQGELIKTPEVDEPNRPANGPMLKDLSEQWLAEKTAEGRRSTVVNSYRDSFKRFLAIAGNKPLSDYSKADGRAYRAVLSKLPKFWTTSPVKDFDIVTAANRAHELGLEPMSPKNRNNLISPINTFWKWANHLYDECPPSPMSGMNFKITTAPRDQRNPFTIQDLQTIFTAPLFTGCKSFQYWKKPGDLIPLDSCRYWVPLIALFTGARLNEILQLYVKDVHEQGDIWFFDINSDGEDKRTKNDGASIREIPIHSSLIGMGFLGHYKARKEQRSLRLFPDAKLNSNGNYSGNFGKFFNDRFLKHLGVKTPKKSFHSFRHNFEGVCAQSNIRQEHIDALIGHRQSGMGPRYNSEGYPLELLASEMGKVKYRGLDLSHLIK